MFKELLLAGQKEGAFSQASLAVYLNNDWSYYNLGENTIAKNFIIDEFSIFDCASVTKTIPTGILALQIIEEYKLDINKKIIEYIPELKMKWAGDISLKHLMTHTLDYSFSLGGLKDLSAEEIWHKLMTWEFPIAPGEKYLYCNSTSVLLGVFIERFFKKSLAEIADEKIFNKLKLKQSTFFPERLLNPNIVPSEIDSWRGKMILGEVHDESAYVLKKIMIPGSAGLFSCSHDLSVIINSLMNSFKNLNSDVDLLSSQTLGWAFKNHTPHLNVEVALGFEKNQNKFMGNYPKSGAVGKTGFTGSCIVMAPLEEKAFVLLTNYTWPKRKLNSNQINEFRSKVSNALWKA